MAVRRKKYSKNRKILEYFDYFCGKLHNFRFFMPTTREINLANLVHIEKFSQQFSNFGHDYLLSHLQSDFDIRQADIESKPMRMNGMSILLCLSGEFQVEVNLVDYIVKPNTIMVIGPDKILRYKGVLSDKIDAYLMALSPDFQKDINIDMSVVQSYKITPNIVPVITLSHPEVEIVKKYFDLLHLNTVTNSDTLYLRNISRCLIAAIIYQMMQFGHSRLPLEERDEMPGRRTTYVRDFIKLVLENFKRERSVAFYASKLFISPKYLSMLMKQASGKSAAEWIDEYVIIEAKSQLRFSGKNVQQIAYDLNFTSQSSFGKYFKHLTGMSPTKFQKM